MALVRRGACPFQAKVENAAAAGAAGVVIMDEGTSGRTDPFRGTLMRPARWCMRSAPWTTRTHHPDGRAAQRIIFGIQSDSSGNSVIMARVASRGG